MDSATIYLGDSTAQIGIIEYKSGLIQFQTIWGIGGEQERVPIRQEPGTISFAINPAIQLEMGRYEIQFNDGRIITAHLNSISTKVENGRALSIVTALTNP